MAKVTQAERAKRLLADLDQKEAARKEKFAQKREVAARRLTAQTFKEDTREMTLIGKYLLPDDTVRPMIEAGLKRADVAEHDLKFLRARGWPL